MIDITEDMIYKFFLTLSLVAAIMSTVSIVSGGLPLNMDAQTLANAALAGPGKIMEAFGGVI